MNSPGSEERPITPRSRSGHYAEVYQPQLRVGSALPVIGHGSSRHGTDGLTICMMKGHSSEEVPMTVDQIELEALKLPAPQRARLAERLISSLDDESEIEKEWLVEVRRRDAELDSGEAEGIPLEDALSSVRGKFDW